MVLAKREVHYTFAMKSCATHVYIHHGGRQCLPYSNSEETEKKCKKKQNKTKQIMPALIAGRLEHTGIQGRGKGGNTCLNYLYGPCWPKSLS